MRGRVHQILLAAIIITGASLAGAESSLPTARAAPPWPTISLQRYGTASTGGDYSFTNPVHITNAGDGRLFVVEQAGIIRVIQSNGVVRNKPFLKISGRVQDAGTEQGLLSLASPPDFATSGVFYVYYIRGTGSGKSTLSRFHTLASDPTTGDRASEEILWKFKQPQSNHNGGELSFGPDGKLYLSLGDGGGGGDQHTPPNGQNANTPLGKIVRFDISQSAPLTPTVVAMGLRNPWKSAWDLVDGRYWIGDVGQDRVEEVDTVPNLNTLWNFGWNIREGNECFNVQDFDQPLATCSTPTNYVAPVTTYTHATGCSVTGGYVYHGTDFPTMEGIYFFADYCGGQVWGYDAGQTQLLKSSGMNISSFGRANDGELFLADRGGGGIYRITAQ